METKIHFISCERARRKIELTNLNWRVRDQLVMWNLNYEYLGTCSRVQDAVPECIRNAPSFGVILHPIDANLIPRAASLEWEYVKQIRSQNMFFPLAEEPRKLHKNYETCSDISAHFFRAFSWFAWLGTMCFDVKRWKCVKNWEKHKQIHQNKSLTFIASGSQLTMRMNSVSERDICSKCGLDSGCPTGGSVRTSDPLLVPPWAESVPMVIWMIDFTSCYGAIRKTTFSWEPDMLDCWETINVSIEAIQIMRKY